VRGGLPCAAAQTASSVATITAATARPHDCLLIPALFIIGRTPYPRRPTCLRRLPGGDSRAARRGYSSVGANWDNDTSAATAISSADAVPEDSTAVIHACTDCRENSMASGELAAATGSSATSPRRCRQAVTGTGAGAEPDAAAHDPLKLYPRPS